MPREKESYRDHLEMLQEAFDNKPTVTLNQIAKYLHKDPRTLKKDKSFPIKRGTRNGHTTCSLVNVARWLS